MQLWPPQIGSSTFDKQSSAISLSKMYMRRFQKKLVILHREEGLICVRNSDVDLCTFI